MELVAVLPWPDDPRLKALIEAMRSEIPDLELRPRASSRFLRIVDRFFPSMGGMVTTLWGKVYLPAGLSYHPFLLALIHEWVHLHRAGPGFWSRLGWYLRYTFPQNLAALALLTPLWAVLFGPWGWLGLLPLAALAPFPAPWRAFEECEAYVATILADYWRYLPASVQPSDYGHPEVFGGCVASGLYYWAS